METITAVFILITNNYMGFLGDLFDDVLDIASIPVKLTASVADKVLYPFEEGGAKVFRPTVDKVREGVRLKK